MRGVHLLTRADDAGTNQTMNRAIRATARQGIVRNISLLAPAPEIEHAAAMVDLAERAVFGLHVCLTAEWSGYRWGPVLDTDKVPTLVRPDGTLPFTVKELQDLCPDPGEVLTEIAAQLDRLTRLGFAVRYMDEHMLVGEIPDITEVLSQFARDKGLLYDRELRQSGRLTPLPGWTGPDEHPGTELADHLAETSPGTYLLTGHPAFKSDEMERLRLPEQQPGREMIMRNRERRMFADIEIVDYCDDARIELLRYTDLA